MSTKEMTNAELEKIHAEIGKLMAETAKLNKETFWYPVAIATGLLAAATAFAATIIKLLA
ncbi:hypothetical protein BUE93_05855 [Chromobacterium amazonense]|uniref:Uncharacterized protein n=1 Tax=Chromobacterium amazonense TaxID=1382803 RepID=A0A2S9X710_9NEIS|nr:hypothetical protein [Chromobacterium amazonense]PRP71522.1 hypothetical protein BUE93_05855 [Chromobacterium amazonense]